MVGQYLIILVNSKLKNSFQKLRKHRVLAGFGGLTGNKGAVAIRFKCFEKEFLFINVHLTSGQNQ
jgi:hypothetical protein